MTILGESTGWSYDFCRQGPGGKEDPMNMFCPRNGCMRVARLLVLGIALSGGGVSRAIPQRMESAASDRLSELRAEIARDDDLYF